MKANISMVTILLLTAINSLSQAPLKKPVSTEVKTRMVDAGLVKQPLIQKQETANRTLLIPVDTANAQMSGAVVDIGFNSAYGVYDVLGRYHLQLFLLNGNNLEIGRWNFNPNRPNVTQDLNAANDGYFHVQLPMEIENTKDVSSFGTLKKGGSLKFVFDYSFQNIDGGAQDYFFINSFTLTLNYRNPSVSTNIWPGNDAEQKYAAGHTSYVYKFY